MQDYDQQEIEEEIREYWRKRNIPKKVIHLRDGEKGENEFLFVEGPPSTTGKMHIGHVRGRTIKDVVFRVKTMQGYYVPRQAGWDMQGLPVELETEKELGLESKKDVEEKVGVENFVNKCRDVADKYKDEWTNLSQKLGMWMDWKNAYKTLTDDHMERAWKVVKKAHEKGLLTKKLGCNPVCPRCQTVLSQHEVDQGYKDREDYSIWVKFPVIGSENEYILIWTTTPWTIPSNIAVGVDPDSTYVKVKVDDEVLILAEEMLDMTMEEVGVEDYEVLDTFSGEDLDGIEYRHPLMDKVPEQKKFVEEGYRHRIFLEDFVTMEEGTGCVHMAPGHGPEDFDASKGKEMPVFCPVEDDGKYTEEGGKYEGEYVFDANKEVINDLEEGGFLFHWDKTTHSYPHCWRCDTPLIYTTSKQWFIETTKLRSKLISENKKVDWKPSYVGEKRFGEWLENLEDNCISRQKYWGTPIPIWKCESCGDISVMGSKEELSDEAKKLPEHIELHKPWVDEVVLECPNCGGNMTRESDVMDVWLDSSVAPDVTLDYIGRDKFEPFDFITEAIDQTRGWYYSLLFSNVILHDQVPYKSVLNQELICDAEGEKMSSSKGNAVWADEALEKWSSDILRFYLLWKVKPYERLNFDPVDIDSLKGGFFNILWNLKNFYKNYCEDIHVEELDQDLLKLEDQWTLSRINSLVDEVNRKMENFEVTDTVKLLKKFLEEDLSRFYVKMIRDRTWPRYKGEDKRAAVYTFERALEKYLKIFAAVCPHITERIHHEINETDKSIHLMDWPEVKEDRIDSDLEGQMEIGRKIMRAANSLRQESGIGLRYPLPKMTVTGDEKVEETVERLENILKKSLNLKEIEFGEVSRNYRLKLNYAEVGPKYGDKVKEIENLLEESDHGKLAQNLREEGKIELGNFELSDEEVEVRVLTPESISGKSFERGALYLNTDQDEELIKESFKNELIRKIQILRKEKGLNVGQDIKLKISCHESIGKLVDRFKEELEKESGVVKISMEDVEGKKVKYKGKEAEISIQVV